MSGEDQELDCKELLKLVTSLQTLTASQQQVNINNFVSFENNWTVKFHNGITHIFQLKEKTRAGNVFLVPVDHTESDNLHIQVTTLHPNHSPVRANQNILISRETITFIFTPFYDACFVSWLKWSRCPRPPLLSRVLFLFVSIFSGRGL